MGKLTAGRFSGGGGIRRTPYFLSFSNWFSSTKELINQTVSAEVLWKLGARNPFYSCHYE